MMCTLRSRMIPGYRRKDVWCGGEQDVYMNVGERVG